VRVEAVLYFVVLAVLSVWALFWIIRLGVRYGMNDALRMNRDWLRQADRSDVDHPQN
jgi:hypothetical protein